jgi:EF-hand domain pair
MSEDEVQVLFDLFVFILTELATVVKFLGLRMSEEEVQALFDEFDEDGSGSIEFDEFLLLISKKVICLRSRIRRRIILTELHEQSRIAFRAPRLRLRHIQHTKCLNKVNTAHTNILIFGIK